MKRPEQELQKSVIQYIRYAMPRSLCFHVPNGGKRSKIEAAIFKAMGVMPGVADLLLFWKGGHGAIELKAGKGTQTPYQKLFQERWCELGGYYAVCTSIEDVSETLRQWGVA